MVINFPTLWPVRWILILALVSSFPGCGGGGSGGNGDDDSDQTKIYLQINDDPLDPMLMIMEGAENGETYIFYGKKDSNGYPINVEAMQFYLPGQQEPTTLYFDDQSRLSQIIGNNGEIASFTYEGEMLLVNFRDQYGDTYVETFSIKDLQVSPSQMQNYSCCQQAGRTLTSAAKTTVKPINGTVTLKLEDGEVPGSPINDAAISVRATNQEYKITAGPIGNGQYNFTVCHRIEDLEVAINKCEAKYNEYSFVAGTGATAMTALAAICWAEKWGFCPWAVGAVGIGFSLLSAGLSHLWSLAGLTCRNLVIKAAVSSEKGEQTTSIFASHKALDWADEKNVEYDLHNPSDPITSTGKFSIDMTIPLTAGFMGVGTTPSIVAEEESYQVVFRFLPPEASINYKVSRPDGFSFEETLNGDGQNYTLTGSLISGAKSGITDTITATLSLYHTEVDSETIYVTFRGHDTDYDDDESPIYSACEDISGQWESHATIKQTCTWFDDNSIYEDSWNESATVSISQDGCIISSNIFNGTIDENTIAVTWPISLDDTTSYAEGTGVIDNNLIAIEGTGTVSDSYMSCTDEVDFNLTR